jgi:hypothetical protein
MPHRRIAPPRRPEFEKNRIGKRPRLTEARIYVLAEGMAAPDGGPEIARDRFACELS